MKKMSLQWRLTIITTLLIAMICGSLTIFIYKNAPMIFISVVLPEPEGDG